MVLKISSQSNYIPSFIYLYRIFCSNEQEIEEDYLFDQTLKKLNFITPKHLDIDESVIKMEYMDFAIKSKKHLI